MTTRRTITQVVQEYVNNHAGMQIRITPSVGMEGREWTYYPGCWLCAVCAPTVAAFDRVNRGIINYTATPEDVLRMLVRRAPDWQMAAYLNTYNGVPEVSLLSVAYAVRYAAPTGQIYKHLPLRSVYLPLRSKLYTPAGLATMDHARRVAMGPIGKHWEWVLRCIHMHCRGA